MVAEPGQQLLHYRLVEKIGEGGMGVVWRAVDTSLDREVAIKILPDAFARDSERLARFEREAKLLASLHHPNLTTVFGVHDADGIRFLAMELVSGEDLSESLGGGPLAPVEAVELARQLAVALEAAHERGVIHRDLKPANIRIADDGSIKILDFGLAKARVSGSSAEIDPALSPTATSVGTMEGVLLGTAAYMSPEQARGREADERSDIWSYGCVLWECLTGDRLFGGPTATDSLGAILHTEPDWSRLPAATPANLRRVLRRCLAKDPRDRLHHIADARIDLVESSPLSGESDFDPGDGWGPGGTSADTAAGSKQGYRIATAVLAIALLVSLAVILSSRIGPSVERSPSGRDNPLAGARFTRVTDFPGSEFDAAISPDGRFIAFVSDRDGPFEVLVTQTGTGGFRKLAGAEAFTQNDARAPISSVGFSGDGSEVWFYGGPWQRLRTMPLLGGPLRNFLGEQAVTAASSPDGERIVYHDRLAGDPLYVADRNGSNRRQILASPAGMHQHYPIWSVDGEWIYLVRGRPATLEMDLWRVRKNGEGLEQLTFRKLDVHYPAPIDERTVLYIAQDADGAGPWLWWLDVETKVSRRASVGLEEYASIAASADGRRLAATVQVSRAELWSVPILDRMVSEEDAEIYADLKTGRALAPRFGTSTLFYLSSKGSGDGLWSYDGEETAEIWRGSDIALLQPAAVSPDGGTVVLSLRRDDGWFLHTLRADGTGLELLAGSLDVRGAAAWSPDGRWVVTGGYVGGVEGLFKIPVTGGEPELVVEGEALNPVWSPEGDLIVYTGTQVNVLSPLLGVRPDGEAVELPNIEVFRFGHPARFLPDGTGLVFMRGLATSQDFWLLDLATMEERQLTQLDPKSTMRTFDITPDGRRIVFDRLFQDTDIVLIELKPTE